MNQNKTYSLTEFHKELRLSERDKKRFEYLLVALLTFLFVLTTLGQSEQTFTATSTFSPSVKDAIKFSDVPEIRDTVKKVTDLKYGITSNPLFPKYQVQQVEAAKIGNESLHKLYKSLLKVGYAPIYNMPYAEYWISSTRSRESNYGAHLRHFSSTTHLDNSGYGGFSENAVNVYGKKFYRKHTLSADFNYDRNVVHYYGYDTSLNKLKNDFTKQRYQLFEPKLMLQSHYTDSTHINHTVSLSYYNLQNLHREAENNIRLNALGNMFINKENLYVRVLGDFYNHKQSNDTINNFIFTLNPGWQGTGKKWKADIGPAITIDKFGNKTEFHIYGIGNFEYDIYENMITPYLSVGGGLIKNSFRSLSRENPFVDTTLSYKNTNNKYTVTGGLKGNLSSRTNYDARVTYSVCDYLYFYVIDYSGNNLINNMFSVIYDDASVVNVSGTIRHQVQEKLSLTGKGNYYLYKTKTVTRAYHRPDFDLTFSGNYNVLNKLVVKADLFIMGNQWALGQKSDNGTTTYQPKLIKGWADMNLEAEYRYSKMLSVFARFNNIAAQRYYRWDRYASQKFNFMVGLSFVPF